MCLKLNFYIAKKFFLNFILIIIAVAILAGIINIFELLDQASGKQISLVQIFLLDVLQIPIFIEDISVFLVLITAMITLFSLSIRSEINVMRASGMSFWQVLSPIVFSAFALGLFFVLIFNPIAIKSAKKFNNMQQKLIEKEEENLLAPKHGIWLKQENILNQGEDIIIEAEKIYRKDLKMNNVHLWFFDQNDQFYKKIDAKNMFLQEGKWYLQKVIINDDLNFNQPREDLEIFTNLKAEFITKKILNNFENVRLFSVYDLPSLINDLKDSGFPPRKFVVYYHSMLIKPFLFVAMALMAGFFAVNNVRSRNNILIFVSGVLFGLILYISFIIIGTLGSSGLIPIFLATWMMAIISISISILLIFRKEVIN